MEFLLLYFHNIILITFGYFNKMIYFMNLEKYNQWVNDGCPINALITMIDLSHANLTSISENIGNFTNLKTLFLNNNLLTHLPESIGRLTELEELDASNNQLYELPESMENLGWYLSTCLSLQKC